MQRSKAGKRWEHPALYGVMAALVLTGGASSAWRLALLALPLLAFWPPARLWLAALGLAVLPSALEFAVYGNWLGGLGDRARLVAGLLVGTMAWVLGARLARSRRLRRSLENAMLPVAIGLLAQAALRMGDLIPPTAQYLSGNNLSALATALLAPTLALAMPTAKKATVATLLAITIVATQSRWGAYVGLVFGLVMLARIARGAVKTRLWVVLGLASAAPLAMLLFSQINIAKAAMVLAHGRSVSMLRPWTGAGPGAAELFAFRGLERGLRPTHVESLLFDWATVWGWPLAIALIAGLLGCALFAHTDSSQRFEARWRDLCGIALLALLAHDLFDHALSSGALGLMIGLLLGGILGLPAGPAKRWPVALFLPLLLGSLGLAHHFDPLRMERQGRLDELPERFAVRSHRYWLRAGDRATDPGERLKHYARSIELAPFDRMGWLKTGDALVATGRRRQGYEAYATALRVTRSNWNGPEVSRLTQLDNGSLRHIIGNHLGAARAAARHRQKGSADDIAMMLDLDAMHGDHQIRFQLQKALEQPRIPNRVAVPALWQLAQRPPLLDREGARILKAIAKREPRVVVSDLFLRMVAVQPDHCEAISAISDAQLYRLRNRTDELKTYCANNSISGAARDKLRLIEGEAELQPAGPGAEKAHTPAAPIRPRSIPRPGDGRPETRPSSAPDR